MTRLERIKQVTAGMFYRLICRMWMRDLEGLMAMIKAVDAADSLLCEEGVQESLSHYVCFHILKDALKELNEEVRP